MRTPGHDFELAAGWLVHEGLAAAGDIAQVAYCTDVDLDARAGVQRRHGDPRRCPGADPGHRHDRAVRGLVGVRGVRQGQRRRRRSTVAPARRWAGPLPDAGRRTPAAGRCCASGQTVFARTGGVHAAGLFTADGELLVVREDVGRHNAVDKVTGARVLAGESPAAACLVVSGRAGFELVQKAVAAGDRRPVVAVGAPTSLAVGLAREAGLACTASPPRSGASATPERGRPRRGCAGLSVPPPRFVACASSTPPTGTSGGRSTGRACSAHQAAYVDHLLEVVASERVDLVVVSGDVYDRALPHVDAVALADEALARLAASRHGW